MKCPHCTHEGRFAVKETRERDSGEIYRRRECGECGGHFATRENVDPSLSLTRREKSKPVRKSPRKSKPSTNPLFGAWK